MTCLIRVVSIRPNSCDRPLRMAPCAPRASSCKTDITWILDEAQEQSPPDPTERRERLEDIAQQEERDRLEAVADRERIAAATLASRVDEERAEMPESRDEQSAWDDALAKQAKRPPAVAREISAKTKNTILGSLLESIDRLRTKPRKPLGFSTSERWGRFPSTTHRCRRLSSRRSGNHCREDILQRGRYGCPRGT